MASDHAMMSLLAISLGFLRYNAAARIIGYPLFAGSQYIGMRRIAEELASRGHQVTLLVSSAQDIQHSDVIDHVIYNVPYKRDFLEEEYFAKVVKKNTRMILNSSSSISVMYRVFCEATLNNTKALHSFKKYDLILTDCSMYCGPLVAEYLNLTRIELCARPPRTPEMFFHHAPGYPSYVPQRTSLNPGKMTFLQRVKNAVLFVALKHIRYFVYYRQFDEIKRRYDINPTRSYAESAGDAELVLLSADFALEYSYPVLPGHKLIGPLNVQPPRPLPPDIQQLVDSSGDEGIILVSFGSNVASVIDRKTIDLMADAFGRLKEKVIWRLKGYIPADLAPNIQPVDWLPQNDLLAHERTRLFVSHLGINSLYESVYYVVPLVGVPLVMDQLDNAILMEERGLGQALDIHTFTADQLYNAIRRVIDEPRFKTTASRISRLMRDRPRTPVQEAADWIEYTLRHGRLTHLRPASVHLTWYQYFLLDVMLFLVMVLVSVTMATWLLWRYVCRLCCGRGKVKTR